MVNGFTSKPLYVTEHNHPYFPFSMNTFLIGKLEPSS